MSTYDQRLEQINMVLKDDLLSEKEKLVFLYKWGRYEWALHRRYKAQIRVENCSKTIMDTIEVFNARHEMRDL